MNKNAEIPIKKWESIDIGESIYLIISSLNNTFLGILNDLILEKFIPLKTIYSFQFSFLEEVFGKIGGMLG